MIQKFLTIAFICTLTLATFQQSAAQDLGGSNVQKRVVNQYNPRYNPTTNKPKNVPLDAPTIASGPRNTNAIPVQDYSLFFIRKPNTNPDEAHLRITLPLSVEGCLNIIPPTLDKIKESPPYLRMFINAPIVEPNHQKDPERGCQTSAKDAYLDLVLNRKDIQSKGFKSLTIRDGTAADEFDIHLDKNKILLTGSPATFVPRTLPGKPNPLEYWFYPENTVILNALDTKDATPEEVYMAIKKLANANNMISMEKAVPFYQQLYDGKNRFFFVDESNTWAKKIGDKSSLPFGTIELKKQMTGISGPFTYTSNHDIFISKPSYFD